LRDATLPFGENGVCKRKRQIDGGRSRKASLGRPAIFGEVR